MTDPTTVDTQAGDASDIQTEPAQEITPAFPAISVDRASIPTDSFAWGAMKWLVAPDTTPGASLTFGEVIVLPGMGHTRHNHPDAEEIIYVLSGQAEQTLDDGEPFTVRSGDTLFIPVGVFHSTINSGWEPFRAVVVYNPGGPEQAFRGLEDYQEVPAGSVVSWTRG